MFKALLRLLSMIVLSVAVIMAVLDATRSIAAEALVVTPLAASWAGVSPATLDSVRVAFAQHVPAFFWDPIATSLLGLPGFVVFAALAGILALGGRRRTERINRFVAYR